MEPLRADDPHRVGPYRTLARLGSGGMGVVYLGRSRSGRLIAVKVIRKRLAADPDYRARFRREVAAARRVTGTFTAPVLDADPEEAWLATAYLPGMTLREAVDTFGPMPPESLRALAGGLAEALAAIHRAGVVHRDLTPANVLLTAGGPRVIDFGIARPDGEAAITQAGASRRHAGVHGAGAGGRSGGDRARERRVHAGCGAGLRGRWGRTVRDGLGTVGAG